MTHNKGCLSSYLGGGVLPGYFSGLSSAPGLPVSSGGQKCLCPFLAVQQVSPTSHCGLAVVILA